ncbi:MAG: inositol monophosphatase family protein [Oryzihumus sp.]
MAAPTSASAPSARSRLVDLNIDAPPQDFVDPQAIWLLTEPGFVAALRPRVLSSTVAVAWVAAGRRAAYVTAGDLRDSVHFASGIALCQAAGCVVTGLFGETLHSGRGGLIAAADAETHAGVLAAVTRQVLNVDTPGA